MELLYQGRDRRAQRGTLGRDVLHDAGAHVRHVLGKGVVAPGADADVVGIRTAAPRSASTSTT